MRKHEEQSQDFNSSQEMFGKTRHIVQKIMFDAGVRQSLEKIGENNATIAQTGVGVTTEILRNRKVREAAKNTGRVALVSSGIVNYDPETNKMSPRKTGIAAAIVMPEVAIASAIIGAKEQLPKLAHEATLAAPNALRNYHSANPVGFKEAGRAALSNIREAIVLPFHVGRAAIQGIMEIHQSQGDMNNGPAAPATA